MAIDLRQNFISAQYIENKLKEFHIYICMHIDFDKILGAIVTCHFSLICNRVMTAELCHIFVSTQYLEKNWIEFDQA